jgi:integrase
MILTAQTPSANLPSVSNDALSETMTPAKETIPANPKRKSLAQHAEALDKLNAALDAVGQTDSEDRVKAEAVWRILDQVSRELEGWPLGLNEKGAVTGLPADFLKRAFADFVQRGYRQRDAFRRELSPRQRRVYVGPFNAVREALQPHVAVVFDIIKNPLRGPRVLAVQTKFNAVVPPSTYDKLMTELLADVFSSKSSDANRWFVRVALLMILRLGVTFSGCMQGLCLIRMRHLHEDHVIVPRDTQGRRWLRVWLDDVTAVAWRALVIARSRLPGQAKLKKRTIQACDPQMILATGNSQAPDKKILRELRSEMSGYLSELCSRAGISPITLTQAMHLTRFVLTARGIYPHDVVAMLAGRYDTSVMPAARTYEDWSAYPALPGWTTTDGANKRPRRPLAVAPPELLSKQTRINWDERIAAEQRNHIAELTRLLHGKDDVPATRRELQQAFIQFAEAWSSSSVAPPKDQHVTQSPHPLTPSSPHLISSSSLLAAWLADLLKQGKRLDTLRSYLSDAKAILAACQDGPVWELGEDAREDIAALDVLERPPSRRMSAWRSWRSFMQQAGLPVAALDDRNPRCEKHTVEENVFTPADVGKLMQALADIGTLEAHEAYKILPIAFHGLLRIDEALSLRICDMALTEAVPYLDIRNAKGGKSRRVFLAGAPDATLNFIREVRSARVAELRKQHPDLKPDALYRQPLLDPAIVDASPLEKVFKRATKAIGLGSCTFHDLRKGGANWHYLNGRDAPLISKWLGHSAPGVTYLSYLRTVDMRQREAVQAMSFDVHLSRSNMAALLSLADSTYVSRYVQTRLTSLGLWQVGQAGCNLAQARRVLSA